MIDVLVCVPTPNLSQPVRSWQMKANGRGVCVDYKDQPVKMLPPFVYPKNIITEEIYD